MTPDHVAARKPRCLECGGEGNHFFADHEPVYERPAARDSGGTPLDTGEPRREDEARSCQADPPGVPGSSAASTDGYSQSSAEGSVGRSGDSDDLLTDGLVTRPSADFAASVWENRQPNCVCLRAKYDPGKPRPIIHRPDCWVSLRNVHIERSE